MSQAHSGAERSAATTLMSRLSPLFATMSSSTVGGPAIPAPAALRLHTHQMQRIKRRLVLAFRQPVHTRAFELGRVLLKAVQYHDQWSAVPRHGVRNMLRHVQPIRAYAVRQPVQSTTATNTALSAIATARKDWIAVGRRELKYCFSGLPND
jgi:hypothetical protein